MRVALRLAILLAVVLLISPFLISSLLIDTKGIPVQGRTVAKEEYIVVRYPSWTHEMKLSIQYDPPDGYGAVAFTKESVTQQELDRSKVGDVVRLQYLLAKDLLSFPGARTLREMHALPFVRMADHTTWSGPSALLSAHLVLATVLLITVAVLLLWRVFRLPGFAWLIATCVLVALAASYWTEFPRALPPPRNDVRTTTATIQGLDRWDWLFRDQHSRGVETKKAIQIASLRFVPLGTTEPVVAVDLIDSGSLPNLHEHDSVRVQYEASAPRIAYIQGATRTFARRNLEGVVEDGVLTLVVFALAGIVYLLFSRFYRRLTERRPA